MKKSPTKKNGSKENTHLISLLSHFTADTAVLYIKTLNFHWNMVGSEFYMYHKLLEEQYKALASGLDDLAERIRQLGGIAPGSMSEFLELACLPETKKPLSQDQMIKELTNSHESMATHCHEIIEFSDSIKDQGTSDLLIDRLREHDKNAWLLRSHFHR